MVMKASIKSTLRLFKKHFTRLLTIIAIVMVSVGFMSGIGEVENKINIASSNYYISQNVSDFYIKSKNPFGFTQNEISILNSQFGEENIMQGLCYETNIDQQLVRIYSFDLNNININKLELKSGNFPQNSNEVLVERKTSAIKGYKIDDAITIQGKEYKVCGIVVNPLIINQIEEPSFTDPEKHIENVVYINSSFLPIVNDVYVTLEDRELFNGFSKNYEEEIKSTKQELEISLGIDNVAILTLYENFGFYSLSSYADKVGLIGIIFVIFFLLVTLLVVYSTMTRLLDEERSQIATLKTLGFSNAKIVSKYIIYVVVGTIVGSAIALAVGYALTNIIYSAFNLQYAMPPYPDTLNYTFYLITFAIMLVATLILTIITALKLVKKKPVTLLIPKTAKAGKKVIIEKMPFIWKRLSFKYKSTTRNVLLFKSRFFMTVISITGATVLVLAGLGLMDCAVKFEDASSLITISLALIVFSATLCALVIYNLTNINVSERNREIATLMVLGYHNKEITGYIFREVYIMSLIGAILGVPLGIGFIEFVFNLIDFGALKDINWWTYLITPIVVMIFSFLSTRLLYKKIVKTDMNASLKTIE